MFDHNDPDIVQTVADALKKTQLAGALHAKGNMAQSFAVVSQCEGRRIFHHPYGARRSPGQCLETNHIFATSLKDSEVSHAVYGDFLPAALAAGRYRAAPNA
jgi:hypothetical protein